MIKVSDTSATIQKIHEMTSEDEMRDALISVSCLTHDLLGQMVMLAEVYYENLQRILNGEEIKDDEDLGETAQ